MAWLPFQKYKYAHREKDKQTDRQKDRQIQTESESVTNNFSTEVNISQNQRKKNPRLAVIMMQTTHTSFYWLDPNTGYLDQNSGLKVHKIQVNGQETCNRNHLTLKLIM